MGPPQGGLLCTLKGEVQMTLKRFLKIAVAVLLFDVVFGSALLFAMRNDQYLGIPGSSPWSWINPLTLPVLWWAAFMIQVLILLSLLHSDHSSS